MSNNIAKLDISPLLNEVNDVVEKRVNMLLTDYSEKYNLYEETYNLIMNVANKSSKKKVVEEEKVILVEKNNEEKIIKKIEKEKLVDNNNSNNFNMSEIISCIKGTIQDEIKPVYKEIQNLHVIHQVQDKKINTLHNSLLDINKKNEDNISELRRELMIMKSDLISLKKNNIQEIPQEKSKENITLQIKEEQIEEEVEEEGDQVIFKEEEKEKEEQVISKQELNKEDDEEEEELFEIEIDDITYYTNNEENGIIYEVTKDEEVGKKVGYLKDGEPYFS